MKLTLCLALLLSSSIYAETIHTAYGGYSSVDLMLASNPGEWNTLYTELHAGPGVDSTVSVNYTQAVIASGPERRGYLQIQGGGSVTYFELGSATITSGFAGGPLDAIIYRLPTPNARTVVSVPTEITCQANSGICSPG